MRGTAYIRDGWGGRHDFCLGGACYPEGHTECPDKAQDLRNLTSKVAAGADFLVTQLFFKGDPHNKTDEFIKESLIIDLQTQKVGAASYEVGTFDIVLAALKK